jgi:hypothetical protein
VWSELGSAFGIDGLVEINPEHAGEQGDCRCKRQEQDDSPDYVFGDPPPGDGPQQRREDRDDHDSQAVAHVHRSKKIARFALKLKIADGAASIQSWGIHERWNSEKCSPCGSGDSAGEECLPQSRVL